MEINDLFKQKDLKAINIGLISFKEGLEDAGYEAVQVDWKPAGGGDEEALAALQKLMG